MHGTIRAGGTPPAPIWLESLREVGLRSEGNFPPRGNACGIVLHGHQVCRPGRQRSPRYLCIAAGVSPPGTRHQRGPPGPRRGDCPLGFGTALDARGVRVAPGSPSTARTLSAGAALRGLMEGISWDPDCAATLRAGRSREPPSRSPEQPLPRTPPSHWPTRQCGAPSHGSEGAVLLGPPPPRMHRQRGDLGSRSPLGARRRPPATCALGLAQGFPPPAQTALVRAPAVLWKSYGRTAGPPGPLGGALGLLDAWLLGSCAPGRLVPPADCSGADCLEAVGLDADAGMLDVRTPGRPPARTSGSLTIGRAPAVLRPALARPVAPPAPALPCPAPPLPLGVPLLRFAPWGERLVTSLSP